MLLPLRDVRLKQLVVGGAVIGLLGCEKPGAPQTFADSGVGSSSNAGSTLPPIGLSKVGKAADCDALKKAVGKNVEAMKKLDGNDLKAMVTAIQNTPKTVKAVVIQDVTLATLADQYVSLWEIAAKATKDLESKLPDVVKKALAAIESVETQEVAVLAKLNAYCE